VVVETIAVAALETLLLECYWALFWAAEEVIEVVVVLVIVVADSEALVVEALEAVEARAVGSTDFNLLFYFN